MTITVLSPYQVFFIDETEKLWTVLKDGRVRFVKSVPAFTNISAKYSTLSGVEFDGEQTLVLSSSFNFSEEEPQKILNMFGYCYYPTLLEGKHPKIALLKADLLNHVGTADLTVYERARTKYHPLVKMTAQIAPPKWSPDGTYLYYINTKGVLVRTNGKSGEKLAQSAQMFSLNKTGNMIAYYDGEYIYLISLETGQTTKIMAFNVTAIGFGLHESELFFASTNGDTHIIQTYNKQTSEIELVARSATAIKMIF